MEGKEMVRMRIVRAVTPHGYTYSVSHDKTNFSRHLPTLPAELLLVMAIANTLMSARRVVYPHTDERFCALDSPPSWRLIFKLDAPTVSSTMYDFVATREYAEKVMGDKKDWVEQGIEQDDGNLAVTM